MLLLPDRSPVYLGGVIFIALLVIVKHQANIQRLIAGTESRFGARKAIAVQGAGNEKKKARA